MKWNTNFSVTDSLLNGCIFVIPGCTSDHENKDNGKAEEKHWRCSCSTTKDMKRVITGINMMSKHLRWKRLLWQNATLLFCESLNQQSAKLWWPPCHNNLGFAPIMHMNKLYLRWSPQSGELYKNSLNQEFFIPPCLLYSPCEEGKYHSITISCLKSKYIFFNCFN